MIHELFARLKKLEIRLWVEGEELRFAAPSGRLSEELRSEIRARKDEIIRFLQEAEAGRKMGSSRISRRAENLYAPLSFAQQRLWFLHQFDPGSFAYNIPLAFRIEGVLNAEVLEQSFREIQRRHESLRTTFNVVQGEAIQVTSQGPLVGLPVEDLRGSSEEVRNEVRDRRIKEEVTKPFDLDNGPPLRAVLLRTGDEEHIFLVVFHHIIADGWSVGVFNREISTVFHAFEEGRESPLPELEIQYGDFSTWQRDWLPGEVLETQLTYWRNQLEGLKQLDLPTDRPRPPIQTFHGETHQRTLPSDLTQALGRFGRSTDTTPSMITQAVFAALLHRYSGNDDITFGIPIANRHRAEVEGLIGYFVNSLAIRTSVGGDPTFIELLARVRHSALESFLHQDLPFEKLVEELQPTRDPSRNPLFQVWCAYQNVPMEELNLGSLRVEPWDIGITPTRFDLELHIWESGDEIHLTFCFNPDLFQAETISRLSQHYENLLLAALSNPETRISALPMVSEEEAHQVVVEWNRTSVEYPGDATLHGLFEAQAERSPDAAAVRFGEEQLTYRELDLRATELARELRRRGVDADSRVGVYMERSIEMVVALLGTLKAGGAYLPLEPTDPGRRTASIVNAASPQVVLTQATWVQALDLAWPTGSGTPPKDILALDGWSPSESAVVVDAPVDVTPADLAYVIFTSGSTGQPKGVMVPHKAICNRMIWMQSEYGLSPKDRVLQKTPFGFDVSVWEFFWPLMTGAELVMAAPDGHKDPQYLTEIIGTTGITTMHFVPSMMRVFLAESPGTHRLPLKRVFSSGEALTSGLARAFMTRFPGTELHNLYGPTEAAVEVTYYPCSLDEERVNVPIGRPVANTRLYILDQTMHPVPVGVFGELHLGGTQVARGYLGQPELTAEQFIPDPWSDDPEARLYKTGDVVRYLPDGNVEFKGRSDFQVKIRGNRIECGEIEIALTEDPVVDHAVVVAREDELGELRLVGYVVLNRGAGEEISQILPGIRKRLAEAVPTYMVPAVLMALPTLPMTPSGKLDRKALPAPERGIRGSETPFVAPRNELEEQLAKIWKELLHLPRVGIEEDFFELGGHSLMATQVVSRIRSACQVQLPLRTFFQNPTIAALTPVIVQARAASLNPRSGGEEILEGQGIPPRTLGEPPVLSFAQQRLWFLNQLDPESSAYNLPLVLRLRGVLDLEALKSALEGVVKRHEILRASFPTVNGEPSQVMAPTVDLAWSFQDLVDVPPDERVCTTDASIAEERGRPFDLAGGPAIRFLLVRQDADDHILVITMHHIVSDGWSLGIINQEISQLYAAFSRGEPSPLPELSIQYADFAYWQRDWMRDEVLQRQQGYWTEQLRGVPTLELPTDGLRPPVQTFEGSHEAFVVPAPLKADLQKLGQQEGVTLAITLQAVFNVLLYRYTHQDDIVVGSPIANRTREEVEGLVGFFVNNLVMRTDLSGDPTALEVIRRVREVAFDAYDHQDLPFEHLVHELRPERDPSRNPLFQIMFAVQNAPAKEVKLEGVSVEPLPMEGTTTRFDLECHFFEHQGHLQGRFVYNVDLFDRTTMQRMVRHFLRLLASVAEDPNCPISSLPLMTAEERTEVDGWSGHPTPYPRDATVHELFEAQVDRSPHATAVEFGDQKLSYKALDQRANRLAHWLRSQGVGPDVLVGLGVERSMEMVVGTLGILKAGGAYLPLDPDYPTSRLEFMLQDADCSVLLTQRKLLERLPHQDRITLCLDDEFPEEPREAEEAGLDHGPPDSEARAGHLAYVMYTSGSTGQPKGSAVEHRSVVRLVMNTNYVELGPEEVFLQFAPLSFDAATFELWGSLLHGAKLVVCPPGKIALAELGDLIQTNRVSVLWLTGAVFQQMVDFQLDKLKGIRQLLSGGEALSVPHVKRVLENLEPGHRLINGYGPTENTTFTCCHVMDDQSVVAGTVPIGRPIANTTVRILDEHLNPVPVGVSGELLTGGDGLARGYLNQPELTAAQFIESPSGPGTRLYRTGDRARFLADGTIEFLGRQDGQVKLRGFRIELGEIESTLADDPFVREAVAMVREDMPGDRRLVAYLVPDREAWAAYQDDQASEGDLDDVHLISLWRTRLQGHIPSYMVPSAFVILDELPVTPNGKVDRRALPKPTGVRQLTSEYAPPESEIEKTLVEIWQDVLQVERVGRHDNFFDLGGHSLLATQVVSRIQSSLFVDLSLRTIFASPTIEGLALGILEVQMASLEPDELSGLLDMLEEGK